MIMICLWMARAGNFLILYRPMHINYARMHKDDVGFPIPSSTKKKSHKAASRTGLGRENSPSTWFLQFYKYKSLELVGIQLRQFINISYLLVHGSVDMPVQYNCDKALMIVKLVYGSADSPGLDKPSPSLPYIELYLNYGFRL